MLATSTNPILKPLPLPTAEKGGDSATLVRREKSSPALHQGAERIAELEAAQNREPFVAECVKLAVAGDPLSKQLDSLLREARIAQAGQDEKSKLPLPPANEPVFIRRIVIPPEPLRLEEAVDKVVWVKRCLDIIAQSVSSIPLRVMRRAGGRFGTDAGEPDYDSVPARRLLRLLERPNAHQSGTDLLEAMSIWTDVRQLILWMMWEPGRARTKPSEAKNKIPDALYCLPAHRAVGMMSEGSLYYWRINGAGGEYSAIPAWQTIRIGDYNPKEELRGNSPLASAYQTADTEFATEIYHANLFERGLMVSGFVSIDAENLSNEERSRYQTLFDQMSGVGNAFAVAVIGKKADYKSMTMNQKDMDYKGLSEVNKRKIAGAMGVPLFMLGEPEAGGKLSAIEARKSFWQDRVIPKAKRIVNKLNVHLVPYFGDENIYLELDTSQIEALSEDRTEFAQAFNQTAQGIAQLTSSGVMSPEDAQKTLQDRFGMEIDGPSLDFYASEEEEIETEDAENEDEILDEDAEDALSGKIMAVAGRVPAVREAKNIVITWILGGRKRRFPDAKIFAAMTRNGVRSDAAGILTERIRAKAEKFASAQDAAAYFDALEKQAARNE